MLEEREQDDVEMTNGLFMTNGVSKSMLEEEQSLEVAATKEEAARAAAYQAERENDIQGGEEVVGSKFKKLEYLLNQSKVGGGIS
jgi:ATP-dependent DNA helicase